MIFYLNAGENEANVRYLLDAYSGTLVLEKHGPRLGDPGLTTSAKPIESVWVTRPARAAADSGVDAIDPCSKMRFPSNSLAANVGTFDRVSSDAGFPDSSASGSDPQLHQRGPAGCAPTPCPSRWLSEEESRLVQRFDPRGDTIGFFIAKFRKVQVCGS